MRKVGNVPVLIDKSLNITFAYCQKRWNYSSAKSP